MVAPTEDVSSFNLEFHHRVSYFFEDICLKVLRSDPELLLGTVAKTGCLKLLSAGHVSRHEFIFNHSESNRNVLEIQC